MKVLVCDPIHQEGIEKLEEAGFEVDVSPTISHEQLKKVVSEYDALIVRSRTKVTREIIEAGNRLKIIGRAGVGLDNIDTETAEKRGITVLNTPEGAALDVYEVEPPKNLTLIRMPNVVCTTHIGAQTEEAQKAAATLIAEKIMDSLEKD